MTDPRIERCKRHRLLDIVTIAICGVICGADSWVEIALNLLQQERTIRHGVKAKRLTVGWDEAYLLKVLLG